MFKLLIVDDDTMIREGIKNAINWPEQGFSDVITAENGEAGLTLFNEFLPEVVLTDIKMPGIDGLELLKAIKAIKQNTKVIILSGFDDFSYAQKAVKLGAFDYVLKTADMDEMTRIVKRAIKEIVAERLEEENEQKLRQQLKLSLPLLKYRYLNQLIFDCDELDRLVNMMAFVDIHFSSETFFVSVVELDDLTHFTPEIPEEKRLIFKMKVFDIINEKFSPLGLCFETKNEEFVCIYFCDEKLSVNDNKAIFTTNMEAVCEAVADKTNMSISIGCSRVGNGLVSVKPCYEEAKRALEHRLFTGKGSIIHIEDIAGYTSLHYHLNKEHENKLLSSLRVGDRNIVTKTIESVFDDMKRCRNLEVNNFHQICIELFCIASRIVSEFDMNMEEIFGKKFLYFDEVKKYKTLIDTRKWMVSAFNQLTDHILNTKILKTKRIIEEARSYIDQNYEKELSLELMAEMFHISPNYFSSLFRLSVGQSFMEYIIERRIEKAKKLLGQKDARSFEIAEKVGYDNPYYFCRIFKKYTGLTPSEYRDSLK